MVNDSSTGGYLLPTATDMLADKELLVFLQSWFVGLTGLSPNLVRPGWQYESPNIPDLSVNWIAFVILKRNADTYVATEQQETNEQIIRHETLELLVSCYGPNSDMVAHTIREGMQVPQNREALCTGGIKVIGSANGASFPEYINNRWIKRVDLPVSLRRKIITTYPVLPLLTAVINIQSQP